MALIWLALVGFAADWSGLHFMVGAFLAGVVLDARWFSREELAAALAARIGSGADRMLSGPRS